MEVKKCCMCGEEKKANLENFAWHRKEKGTYQSYCRPCQRKYRRRHYLQNKQKYIDKAKKWDEKTRKEFYLWLKTKSCQDCGNPDFRVLEFDHVRGSKKMPISQMIARFGKNVLQEEIKKCDIVCANCHRIRTAEREGYYKYLQV